MAAVTGGPTPEWEWPSGPGAKHILGRQHELAELLAPRIPIFLDTNFWVSARQAATGEKTDPDLISLLGALRLAVQSGKAFFPVTSDLIVEFSKQPIERFEDTMMMVDLLSLGVAMVPHPVRAAIEIESFMAKAHPDAPPIARPLWTCVAFSFGYEDICPEGVKISDALLVGLADTAWMAPPSFITQGITPQMFEARSESERIAAFLNEQEALHAHEIDSYATAVAIEVDGAASMIESIAAREFRRVASAAGHNREAHDIGASREFGRQMAAIVGAALAHEVNRRGLGSLYVPAVLHAVIRSEAKRKVKANDIFDFRHAAAALPYCRAFFTDSSLKTVLTSGHTKLDRIYDCAIAATPAEAIAVLKALLSDA